MWKLGLAKSQMLFNTTASTAISVRERSFVSIGFSLLGMGQAQFGDPTNNQMGPNAVTSDNYVPLPEIGQAAKTCIPLS
jgi:hypothetical protein